MILRKPAFEILTNEDPGNILSFLELAGRVCYQSESKGRPEELIEKIVRRGHESVIEHFSISVRIICDRGVSHEIVRHRLASYSQESTRYCNYAGGVTFIIPPWVNIPPGEYSVDDNDFDHHDQDGRWAMAMLYSEVDYVTLLDLGWTPQQARLVLPNSLKTELIMTANLREWRHILRLRTSKAAHPQMREIAIPMLKQFKLLLPVIFNDIEVN